MPENIHYIYSEVKPAQCFEIAARYAVGEFIIPLADDVFFSPHALDALYEHYQHTGDRKTVVTAKYAYNEQLYKNENMRFFDKDMNSPLMIVAGLINKKTWNELGGIDRRFVALCWDQDVMMRLYQAGGHVELCENAIAIERSFENTDSASGLYRDVGFPVDRRFLESLWVDPYDAVVEFDPEIMHCINKDRGILFKERKNDFEPFCDKHILTVSQGNKLHWK